MRKPPTGEPCAGEPHARFGGRGRRKPFPTPINRDLKSEVEAGRFREDLYFRLNVFEIDIPPLRKRLDDLPGLVEHLIHRHNAEMKTNYKGVDSATMRILMSLPWKGNIR